MDNKMEIDKAKELLMKNSQKSSLPKLKEANDSYELSSYKGGWDESQASKSMIRLKASFPALPSSFYVVLLDRAQELGISSKRLTDAVNHVIDNCVYPTPTIAQFLSFDKKIKLYDYQQFLRLNHEMENQAGKYYKAVRIEGQTKPLYASVKDIDSYSLEAWNR